WPKALAYLRQAGARAATRSAYREAVTCFEQALLAVTHLPEDRETIAQAIEGQLDLQGPLAALGPSREQQDYLRSGQDLRVTLQARSRLGGVLALECISLRAALELDRALEAGERALAIAADLGEPDLQGIARYGLGVTFHELGDLVRARDSLRWAVQALDRRA